ncbi:MAG: hypothetical protein IPI39_10320 [Candidatus Obscuribacter sp.]|nr:hypothetical protein [Candidatus Obscuribacter sp.]
MHYKAQDAAISRRLTRQFGKQFARILADSPTLRSDLRKLDALDVRIQRWNGRQEAYCRANPARRKNSFIAIGSLASPVMKAIYLAHEAYHVLYGTTPGEPNPSRISRKKYVSMGVAEETRAFMHQTKVAHELWSSCNHVLPAWQMHLLLVYHLSGYSNMKDHVLLFKESVNYGFYEDAYGRLWDQSERKIVKEQKAKKQQRQARQKLARQQKRSQSQQSTRSSGNRTKAA